MKLTGKEIFQVQFVLPVQGNLAALKMATQIKDKLNVKEEDANDENIREIDFKNEEIKFLKGMINALDQNNGLNIHGLSLYDKILNTKE
jgi:hypothetical protein